MRVFFVGATALLAANTSVMAQDVCAKLLDHGINNIALRVSAQASADRFYWRFCDESYESMSDAKKDEFGFSYGSIEADFGSAGSSNSQKHSKFCGKYKTSSDRHSSEAVLTNTMHDKAIDAWRSCIETTKREMFIDFRVSPTQKYVEIAMRYTGSPSPTRFNGVETMAFNCTLAGNPIGPATQVDVATGEILIRCDRQGIDQTIGGVTSKFYPEAAVTVKTDKGNGSVDFVPIVDGPAKSRFEQVDRDIAEVQANVDKATTLSSKSLADMQARLKNWPNVEKAGNRTGSTHDAKGVSQCPKGYYMTGLRWWGAPGHFKYCIGCLSGMEPICRPLNP